MFRIVVDCLVGDLQFRVQAKRIPAMKVGRNWIIPRGELLEFAKTYVKGPGRRKSRPEGETS